MSWRRRIRWWLDLWGAGRTVAHCVSPQDDQAPKFGLSKAGEGEQIEAASRQHITHQQRVREPGEAPQAIIDAWPLVNAGLCASRQR